MSNDTYKIATGFMAELDAELPITRAFLERLPDSKLLWKPHEKSMTAGQLAIHIARVPGAILGMGMQDSAEVPDLSNREQPTSTAAILTALDESINHVKKGLITISDQRMHENIRITKDGKELMVAPRVGFLRRVMLNHLYHHRGQFGVYLRLLGCSVPASYGPSGDEG